MRGLNARGRNRRAFTPSASSVARADVCVPPTYVPLYPMYPIYVYAIALLCMSRGDVLYKVYGTDVTDGAFEVFHGENLMKLFISFAFFIKVLFIWVEC